jgi:mitochondrial fission protein ELM1
VLIIEAVFTANFMGIKDGSAISAIDERHVSNAINSILSVTAAFSVLSFSRRSNSVQEITICNRIDGFPMSNCDQNFENNNDQLYTFHEANAAYQKCSNDTYRIMMVTSYRTFDHWLNV